MCKIKEAARAYITAVESGAPRRKELQLLKELKDATSVAPGRPKKCPCPENCS